MPEPIPEREGLDVGHELLLPSREALQDGLSAAAPLLNRIEPLRAPGRELSEALTELLTAETWEEDADAETALARAWELGLAALARMDAFLLAAGASGDAGAPAAVEALALAAAQASALGEESLDELFEDDFWQPPWTAIAACLLAVARAVSWLAKRGPVGPALSAACAEAAEGLLACDSVPCSATGGAVLCALSSSAAAGAWPQEALDDNGRLSAESVAVFLACLERHAMLDYDEEFEDEEESSQQERDALENQLSFKEPALLLGSTLALSPAGERVLLALASLSRDSIADLPCEPDGVLDGVSGRVASIPTVCWAIQGAVEARPELAMARDARGHSPASLLNEALSLPEGEDPSQRGWVQPALREEAVDSLCAIIEASGDPMCLVAIGDPATIACCAKARAHVQRVALGSASAHAPPGAGPDRPGRL